MGCFIERFGQVDPTTPVAACPGWNAIDLLAHQVHQLAGLADGTFPLADAITAVTATEGQGRAAAVARQERWIDEGVRLWRTREAEDLLATWSRFADEAHDIVLDGLLPDIAVHVFDLGGAAGSEAHRSEEFVREAVGFWAAQAHLRVTDAGWRGLRVDLDDRSFGASDAEVVVVGPAFEVLRVLTGRRSREQASALVVASPSTAASELIAAYGWRPQPLQE